MSALDLDMAAASLPAELRAVVSAVGFSKVAQTLLGVDGADEHAAYARIGAELFLRRKEAALINRGLAALNALEGR